MIPSQIPPFIFFNNKETGEKKFQIRTYGVDNHSVIGLHSISFNKGMHLENITLNIFSYPMNKKLGSFKLDILKTKAEDTIKYYFFLKDGAPIDIDVVGAGSILFELEGPSLNDNEFQCTLSIDF